MRARDVLKEATEFVVGFVVLLAFAVAAVWVLFLSGGSSGGGTNCNRVECVENDGGFVDHPDIEDLYDYDYEDIYPDYQQDDPYTDGYEEGYNQGYEEGSNDGDSQG